MISISKDDLWKGAIEDFIGPFIEYFYPDYIHLIDWTRPIQFLDTELSRIVKGIKKGSKTADKLVKAYLKDGKENWFLIHVEVQSQPDHLLAKRMFTMYYRIKDKYDVDIAPLAILAYKGAKDINVYKEKFWGVEFFFKFKTYNIFNEVESGQVNNIFNEVESGQVNLENIFGLVIKSFFVDMKYSENDEEKYNQKIKLIDNFFGRKSSPKEFEELLNFITIFIRLNDSFDFRLKNYITKKTDSKGMGLKELFKNTLEKEVKKEVSKRERIIAKKDEALLEKDEALSREKMALLDERNKTICRSYENGIDIPMIVNITNLSTKEVKSVLKKFNLL